MLPSLFYRVFLFQFSSIWFSHYDTGDTVAEFAIRFVSLTDEKLVVAMFHTHTHTDTERWRFVVPGATRDIGTVLTRICLRHRAVEARLKTFSRWLRGTFLPHFAFGLSSALRFRIVFFLVLACWLLDVAWRSASSFLFQKCVPQFVFFLTIVGLQSAV